MYYFHLKANGRGRGLILRSILRWPVLPETQVDHHYLVFVNSIAAHSKYLSGIHLWALPNIVYEGNITYHIQQRKRLERLIAISIDREMYIRFLTYDACDLKRLIILDGWHLDLHRTWPLARRVLTHLHILYIIVTRSVQRLYENIFKCKHSSLKIIHWER